MVNSLAIAVAVSGVCAAAATVTSSWEIYMHLTHYVQPQFQLHIVRILVMVPIYSVTSFLALFVSEYWGLLLDIVRDGYEAYVIYNFVVLLIEFSGGDRRLIYFLETRPRMHHPFPLRDRLPPIHLGAPFVFAVRAACLQFVFAKPAGSLFLLYITAHPDSLLAFRGAGGLVYLANNISVTVALYALVLFYHAAEELLRPYRPLPKFLAVKAVIFFSFWQGVALSVAIRLGALKDVGGYSAHEQATGLQDVLICVEMLAAAVCHAFVFPYTEHVAAVAAAAAPDGVPPASAFTGLYGTGRRGGGGRVNYGSLSAGSGDVEAALGAAGGGSNGRAARAKRGGGRDAAVAAAPTGRRRHAHPALRNFGDVLDVRDVLADAKNRLYGSSGGFERELRDSEPLVASADTILGDDVSAGGPGDGGLDGDGDGRGGRDRLPRRPTLRVADLALFPAREVGASAASSSGAATPSTAAAARVRAPAALALVAEDGGGDGGVDGPPATGGRRSRPPRGQR